MPDPLFYLKAMGVAAIASAVGGLAIVAVWRKGHAAWLQAACVFSVAAGLVVGYSLLALQLSWPPRNGLERFLLLITPALLGVELVAAIPAVPRWGGWSLRVALALVLPRILLHGSVYLGGTERAWPLWQAFLVMTVSGLLLVGLWSLLTLLCRRLPGMFVPCALQASTLCAGLTVMMAGYIKGGAAALVWTAALLATILVVGAITRNSSRLTEGAWPALLGVGVVGLFSLVFIGRFFGELSSGDALVILLAPLLGWLAELPWLKRRQPWFAWSVRSLLVASALLTVLILAKRKFDREMAPLLVNAEQSTVIPVADTHLVGWAIGSGHVDQVMS
ncbi:MAG: hypothetical protein OSB47_10780 [Pirellulaceae bacterium]|nr:hypothetical protein [Pirellulaceae bacterium]